MVRNYLSPHKSIRRRDGAALREKIASQKASIVNLPMLTSIVDETGITSPETKARAQLIKELSDNEEQLDCWNLSGWRVAAVVRLRDELHPPQNSEDCPICLETIKLVNSTTIIRLFCCGGLICKQCSDERAAKYKSEILTCIVANAHFVGKKCQ